MARVVFQTLASTLTEAFTAAAEVAKGTPGETTSNVRAYASLVIEQVNGSTSATAEEAEEYQARSCKQHRMDTQNVALFSLA